MNRGGGGKQCLSACTIVQGKIFSRKSWWGDVHRSIQFKMVLRRSGNPISYTIHRRLSAEVSSPMFTVHTLVGVSLQCSSFLWHDPHFMFVQLGLKLGNWCEARCRLSWDSLKNCILRTKATSRISLTNVFKVTVKFKAMQKSTAMPSLNVIQIVWDIAS